MPRKYRLYFDQHNKHWFHKIDGKKVYFGAGKSKTNDYPAYERAYAKYLQYLQLNNITTRKQRRKEAQKRRYTDKRGFAPAGTIARAIDEYNSWHLTRYEAGDVSHSHIKNMKWCMNQIIKFFGEKGKIYDENSIKTYVNGVNATAFHKQLSRRITGDHQKLKQLSLSSATMILSAFKDWCKFCYEKNFIDEIPRTLPRLNFRNINKRSRTINADIKTFSVAQIHKLLSYENTSPKSRQFYPLKLFILLGLNCGYTSVDIGTLQFKHLVLNENGDVERLVRERHKTGQHQNHKLWPQTINLLNAWLLKREEMNSKKEIHNDLIFVNRLGQAINDEVVKTVPPQEGEPKHTTGWRRDSVYLAFKHLKDKVLPETKFLSHKHLRKTSATQINKLNLQDTLLMETLFLGHAPTSMARRHYTRLHTDSLDVALEKLNDVYRIDEVIK